MSFIEWISTDNPFSYVDQRFWGEIWRTIDQKLRESRWWTITVCDIACGPETRAITDVVRTNRWRVYWLGFDFQLDQPKKTRNLLLQSGDVFDIGPDFIEQADVVYCAHILGKIAQYRDNHLRLLSLATGQISKTLKRWWVALLDEWIYSLGESCFPIANLRSGIAAIHPQFLDDFSLDSQVSDGSVPSYLRLSRRV